MSLLVVVLEVLACLGYGALALRAFGLHADVSPRERAAWSFALGFGLLGWGLFFLGWAGFFHAGILTAILLAGAFGIIALGRDSLSQGWAKFHWIDRLLLASFIFVGAVDMLEALAPPADADTLAYHFALPKEFVRTGTLTFVRRAIDGAAPLLVQMTYIPALSLGGERAMTLWCMVSGWAAGWMFYVLLTRYVTARIAAAASLIFMSAPVVLAGAGSGQVETRITLFTIVAAMASVDFLREGRSRMAALAGLMSGFYMASKYLGLMFVAAVGFVGLGQGLFRRRAGLGAALAFPLFALAGGLQWYFWNWLHTGDPIFPMLTGKFGIGDPALWPADLNDWFQAQAFAGERPVPHSLFWLFAFPVHESLIGFPEFGGGRVGVGPFVALVIPFAVISAWYWRKQVLQSPILTLALLASVFYAIWFFANPSLRVRHLLPVYPLVLAVVTVSASRFADRFRAQALLAAAFAVGITIQIGGQALYGVNYARHAWSGETREAFLERNVAGFAPVPWINENLGGQDRIFVTERPIVYLLDAPTFAGHPYNDPRVDLRPGVLSPEQLMDALGRYGITHVLARLTPAERPEAPWDGLLERGCLDLLQRFAGRAIESRTIGTAASDLSLAVFRISRDCR